MYFYPQPDFVNTRVFLPPELQYQPNKKAAITLAMVNTEHRPVKKAKGKAKPEGVGPLGTDVKVRWKLKQTVKVGPSYRCADKDN